jgi:hypothetical protein
MSKKLVVILLGILIFLFSIAFNPEAQIVSNERLNAKQEAIITIA